MKRRFLSFALFCIFCLNLNFFVFADQPLEDERTLPLVLNAMSYLGIPYLYGSMNASLGLDCSGFVSLVLQETLGGTWPRTASDLYTLGVFVKNDLQPADLVFFSENSDKISHVGISLGNNYFIHAASRGALTGVIISSLTDSWYKQYYTGAKRIIGE